MGEATLSLINQFQKKLAAERNSGDFLARLNKRWDLVRIVGNVGDGEARKILSVLQARPKVFREGVLESVHALGDLARKAQMTNIPGGETLHSQSQAGLMKFKLGSWHFNLKPEETLETGTTVSGQVIYLLDTLRGSLGCNRAGAAALVGQLPPVEGLRWTLGNAPTIVGILANHLKTTGSPLLCWEETWVEGYYQNLSQSVSLMPLSVGCFDPNDGVRVHNQDVDRGVSDLGVFVLGVPDY